MSDQRTEVKKFIVDNFLFGNADGLNDDTSFLEEGIIDSTGVLELIAHLEEKYDINIEDEEIIPENLDSVAKIDSYLKLKMENFSAAAS